MDKLSIGRIGIYIVLLLFIIQHCIFEFYNKTVYLNIASSIILLLVIFKDLRKTQINELILLLIIMFVLFLYNLFNMDYIGLGACVFLFSFWLHYIILQNSTITSRDYKYIRILFFCLLLWLNFKIEYLMLQGYNTNTLGFCFLTCGIYSILLTITNKLIDKVLYIFSILLTSIGLLFTDSRTCLLAFFIFLLLSYFPIHILKKKAIYSLICIVLTLGSLIYVYLYVYLFKNSIDISDLFFFSKKSFFSGREIIWNETLDLFKEKPFMGIGTKVSLRFYDSLSLHNSMLNLLAIYGLIVFTPTLIFLLRSVLRIRYYIENSIEMKAVIAFWTFLIVGFTETCLFQEAFACSFSLLIAYSSIKKMPSPTRYI